MDIYFEGRLPLGAWLVIPWTGPLRVAKIFGGYLIDIALIHVLVIIQPVSAKMCTYGLPYVIRDHKSLESAPNVTLFQMHVQAAVNLVSATASAQL